MKVVITGASGFIGTALCRHLRDSYDVVGLSRDSRRAQKRLDGFAKVVEWDGRTPGDWAGGEKDFCIVNLAGDNVASRRWNQTKRGSIMHSRSDCSRAVLESIRRATNKPKVVIQA